MEIETKDAVEAAFLWSQTGIDFDRCRPEPGRRKTIFFVFRADSPWTPDKMNEIRTSFFNERTVVEPRAFAKRQIDIADILHAVLRKGKVR
jgi:hypothetical protein